MNSSDELLHRANPSALLTFGGAVRSLNAAMATALGRSEEQCVGRGFGELWPEHQRSGAESLVAHAAASTTVAMRALEFPGPGSAAVACLIEARQIKDRASSERLVWVHALDARNDLASLLIPILLAAKANSLGMWLYSPREKQLEWMGGAPALFALFPEVELAVSSVVSRVHPSDQEALRKLLNLSGAESAWIRLRYLTEHDGWHQLACQARRVQLGYDGPAKVFVVVRDDSKRVQRREKMQAALSAERHRADGIASFSSALVAAATEQELLQVVLVRLAATFGGAGAVIALVDDGRLRVSTDAGIAAWEVEAVCGLSLDDPSPLPDAIRSGTPQFIPDRKDYIRRWPRGTGLPRLSELGSDYALSVTALGNHDDEPLGGWAVAYDSGHQPSLNEWAFMNTLGNLVGQALRRIRLQQARVELATTLQQSMLPKLPRSLPGLEVAARYRPSQGNLDIGGDWYDAFVMPDGAVALEIGDVQGHDVDAAAFMGQVRLSMRAIAAHGPGPGTVLTRTNELLVAMDPARFASCTMLHVDPREGAVSYANAGHVPMLFAHGDGSHDVLGLSGGPVLGVVPDSDYHEEIFSLDEDGALVMVTDGLVESANLSLDTGLDRVGTLAAEALHDGLDAEGIADRILDAADAVDHLDDLAALVIRRTR